MMRRKKAVWLMIAASAAGLMLTFICGEDRNTGNSASGYREDETLFFSREAGFYDEPFYLEISAPGKEIYYTLDGTDPDRSSLRYTGPIWIGDASGNENVHSSRTDVSSLFYEMDEQWNCTLTQTDYVIPQENVDKCTILKAVYYDAFGGRSEVRCASYFVGFDEKEGYSGCKVISLITDPDNLFGSENGIYVLGDTFDSFAQEKTSSNRDKNLWWDANYRNRGREWEREVTVQFFDAEGKLFFSQNCGARIHGGASRAYAAKSLNLYARKEYDGNRYFQYDFWNTGYYADVMTLSAGGNDWKGKIQNPLVSGLVKNLDFATMNYDTYLLFLNGEYWGIYNLTEKYNANYVSCYYSVPKEDVLMVKNGELEDGKESDFYLYQEMMAFVEEADLTDPENYRKVTALFDMDSLIDYFAAEIYISRCVDWPESNYALWRTVTPSGSEAGDGKWRWMLFDVDSGGLTEDLIEYDTIQRCCENSRMFANLCTNAEFRQALGSRILELGSTCFEAERANNVVDAYVSLLDEPMQVYYRRFFGTDNTGFYEYTDSQKAFLSGRAAALPAILEAHDMLPE